MVEMRTPESTAIITGAGQGIGRAIAHYFLINGYRVVIAEIDPEAGAEAFQELSPMGPVQFFQTDVADEGSVQHLVAETIKAFGRIDVLINNAGIMQTQHLEETSLAEWNRILAVNLTGMFLCAKHTVAELRRSKGSIVNIASTRAIMSEPHTEAYSASKGGIVSLTHSLAISLGPEVRVNCISPGWIDVTELKKSTRRMPSHLSAADHEQHPAGRVGRAEDVAAMALYLCSEEAGFMTGQNVVIDGGMTRKMMYV